MKKSCVIITLATGKYIQLFEDFYLSCKENFLPEFQKHFIVMTDQTFNEDDDITVLQVPDLEWPKNVLHTYHHILSCQRKVLRFPYVFYMDVDMRPVDKVEEDILPDQNKPFVGVAHPGYFMNQTPEFPYGTPEENNKSQAYYNPEILKPNCYYAGAFQGGLSSEFLSACHSISMAIDIDFINNITAIYHDESHWNKFLATYKDSVRNLAPLYCFPENAVSNYGLDPKIITLAKSYDWTEPERLKTYVPSLWG